MAHLRLDGISKRYSGKEEVQALQPVDLEFADGEFITILGPSGSGKTTLLNIVVGVVEPTGGRVLVDGADMTYADPRARDMAMVFQNYALYPSKSIRGNLEFPLRMQKTPRDERRRQVDAMAALLDLSDYVDRYPRELSGGQQQRVALGRALIRQPKVFLMDEPLSNLDAKLRLQMRTEIKRLHREYPVTTIYVTHDQSEAMALSDRVVVMSTGRVVQVGTPHEIYWRPASSFVAGFVGSPPMNLLPVGLARRGEAVEVRSANGTLLAQVPADTLRAPLEERAIVGIRPAHIVWTADRDPGPGGPWVQARVEDVDALGEDTLVRVEVDGEVVTIVERGGRVPTLGQAVHLRLPAEVIHLFGEADQESLRADAAEEREGRAGKSPLPKSKTVASTGEARP